MGWVGGSSLTLEAEKSVASDNTYWDEAWAGAVPFCHP